jgi:hypothetical protein
MLIILLDGTIIGQYLFGPIDLPVTSDRPFFERAAGTETCTLILLPRALSGSFAFFETFEVRVG